MLALLLAMLARTQAAEWSGVIRVDESLLGPSTVGGSDRAELEDYSRLLRERLQKAQQDAHNANAPLTLKRILLEDIGTYEAELERIVLASGKAIQVGTSTFTIKGGHMQVTGDGPRLLVDRTHGQEILYVGGKKEIVPLAPMPAVRELDKDAQDLVLEGIPAKRFVVRAEGKVCTVILAPGLPNPYAIGLLSSLAEEKETITSTLATLPGLPLLVEYRSDEVTHRWQVSSVVAGAVDEAAFKD